MCVYILKDLNVHVSVVITINMYGNTSGGFVNKTWEQVMAVLTLHEIISWITSWIFFKLLLINLNTNFGDDIHIHLDLWEGDLFGWTTFSMRFSDWNNVAKQDEPFHWLAVFMKKEFSVFHHFRKVALYKNVIQSWLKYMHYDVSSAIWVSLNSLGAVP